MIIYKATNRINGKIYIGQSQHSLQDRIKGHFRLSRYKEGGVFQKAIREYGENNFRWQVICLCPNINSLDEREQYYIAFYDSMNTGYNNTSGGKNYKTSKKTKERLKQSNLNRIKMKKDKTKQVSVPIDYEVWTKLLIIKKRTGNSLVSIIRTAIDEYLQRNTPTFKIADKENGS